MRRLFPPIAAVLGLVALVIPAGADATARSSTTTVHLDGVRTTLTTDPATTGVLVSHGILPLPVGSATVVPQFGTGGFSLRYAFPITQGTVNAASLAGYINHSGGLRFVNIGNGHTLTLSAFRIVISSTPNLSAAVNGNPSVRVRVLDLDLSHAAVIKHPPVVNVSNVKATLTATAATALNHTLGVSFFSKGITLGTAQVQGHIG